MRVSPVFERRGEKVDGLEALSWIACHCLHDDLLEVRVEGRREGAGRGGVAEGDLEQQVVEGVAFEG